MIHSEQIGNIAAALSAAQGQMKPALKDTVGQIGQQKTKYADLAACWEACREVLSKNGISVIQTPAADGPRVTVSTLLAHKSGEWVKDELTMISTQNTPQAIGSAITYARRYSLCGFVGISPEDDDGTAASQKPEPRQNDRTQEMRRPTPTPAPRGPVKSVAESEIPKDFQRREMPVEMLASFERIQKNRGSFVSTCEAILRNMQDKYGHRGETAYYSVSDAFSKKYPNGTTDIEALREILIDLHEAGENLQEAA